MAQTVLSLCFVELPSPQPRREPRARRTARAAVLALLLTAGACGSGAVGPTVAATSGSPTTSTQIAETTTTTTAAITATTELVPEAPAQLLTPAEPVSEPLRQTYEAELKLVLPPADAAALANLAATTCFELRAGKPADAVEAEMLAGQASYQLEGMNRMCPDVVPASWVADPPQGTATASTVAAMFTPDEISAYDQQMIALQVPPPLRAQLLQDGQALCRDLQSGARTVEDVKAAQQAELDALGPDATGRTEYMDMAMEMNARLAAVTYLCPESR